MIPSLLLLSAGVFVTPVFISEVKATREAGHLRVEVLGDGGIDPDGARTRIDDGILLIYLPGTRVRADNRAWELDEGAGEIRAHRHRTETELVVPLAGNGCTGPVELTGSTTGITALVGCDGTVAAPRSTRAPAVIKLRQKSPTEQDKLKALVELPAEARAEATPVPTAAKAVAVADEPKPRVAAAEPVAVPPVVPPVVLPVLAAPTPIAASLDAPSGESAGKSLRAVALPALLLGALALAAYLFARRRRGSMPRHIQIMETASLGPKRSLIVARIGTQTLILGSSEAGITLLKGGTTALPILGEAFVPAPSAATDPMADTSFEITQPLEEALADIPEPDSPRVTNRGGFRAIEGGLAGLFRRRGGKSDNDDGKDDVMSEAPATFDDLLEDSVEDQELRQKLAAGMSARVR